MAAKRISGLPIQYILGEWDFMGLTFDVGKGVLIPRPETEILCEWVINKAESIESPVIIDLCSGSGCIGLSIAHYIKDSKVYLVEKSDEALKYIECNKAKLSTDNAQVIHADIFNTEELFSTLPKADVIVSNPPYIRSDDIPGLQSEVHHEPLMALDGGTDGLIFYRCLCEKWTYMLKSDGVMALECGEDQAQDIAALFKNNSMKYEIIKDYNNIERIVIGGI